MKQLKERTKEEIRQILDDAWLGIRVDETKLYNPLQSIPNELSEQPHIYLTWLLSRPEYFSLFCKEILNVEILPTQAVLLEELWKRRFPILIASRGFSKSFCLAMHCLLRLVFMPGRKVVICGAGFRQSKIIFDYMDTIWRNAPRLRDLAGPDSGPKRDTDMHRFHIGESVALAIPIGCLSGDTLITTNNQITTIQECINKKENLIWSDAKFRDIGFYFNNGIHPTKKIQTKRGYQYIGTFNHKMKVVRNNKILWCRTDELVLGDYILIDRSERWINPSFSCNENQAYALGAMIGDGGYVNTYRLQFTTKDQELLDRISIIGNFKGYDGLHYYLCSKKKRQDWLDFWGLEPAYTVNKKLPDNLLKSDKKCVAACISGLFDTDGTVSLQDSKGGYQCVISLTNISEKLMKQVQYILLHFGIISTLSSRQRYSCRTGNKNYLIYELFINGEDIEIFHEKIGFKLSRKNEIVENYLNNRKRKFSINSNIVPIDKNLLLDIVSSYKVGHRFGIKDILVRKNMTFSYLEKFILKCQEKNIIHPNLDIIKIFVNRNYYYDSIKNIEDIENVHTYDLNVPENNEYCANGFYSHNSGEKIRGLRANDVIADEMASISRDVFETVIAGFGVVSANVTQTVKQKAQIKLAKSMNINLGEFGISEELGTTNQLIISGTTSYTFNHFYDYWKKWKNILETRGDVSKLNEILQGNIPEGFNWKDYSIIRIPVEMAPPGFIDDAMLARSRASYHSSTYAMEYGAVFSNDSNGFFKRSLIESCVVNDINPICLNGEPILFEPMLVGNPTARYVFGIDPASEQDNFSIVVLEVRPDHRRIVHCWTANRKGHKERVKAGAESENDFYSFCVRKIRSLMKRFPCERIAIDSQGGGIAVYEGLHDIRRMNSDELPLWPIIDYEKPKDTDGNTGLHILDMINFSSADWVSGANNGMRKDFEEKILLFPRFDAISLGLIEMDATTQARYDSLEDCMFEIEELKNELATIIITQTANGRDRWDTPEIKLPGNKKGRMRKDRYSALLMANMTARTLQLNPVRQLNMTSGGFASNVKVLDGTGYVGPSWFTEKMKNIYDNY